MSTTIGFTALQWIPDIGVGDDLTALPAMGELLRDSGAPVIAISPLVGSQAVKGPTAKIMTELGLPVTPPQVAQLYAGWIDGFVLGSRDEKYADQIDMPILVTDTLMLSLADRERLARETLKFAATFTEKRTLP